MKSTILLLMISAFAICKAQSLEKLDEKYGFRKYIFETDKNKFNDLKIVEQSGEKVYYNSPSDSLSIGDYKLDVIYYAFYKGKLSSVVINVKGLNNSRGFLDILETAYGKGRKLNRYLNDYGWLSKKVFLSYTENSITGDSRIYIASETMRILEEKDKGFTNLKAVKGL